MAFGRRGNAREVKEPARILDREQGLGSAQLLIGLTSAGLLAGLSVLIVVLVWDRPVSAPITMQVPELGAPQPIAAAPHREAPVAVPGRPPVDLQARVVDRDERTNLRGKKQFESVRYSDGTSETTEYRYDLRDRLERVIVRRRDGASVTTDYTYSPTPPGARRPPVPWVDVR